jgi:cytochrome P450 family 710 subfamily A protein
MSSTSLFSNGKRTLKVAVLSTVIVLFILEQIRFLRKRLLGGSSATAFKVLPGPSIVPPVIGKIIDMVYDPPKFWDDQRNFGDLSWNSIVGQFTVLATRLSVVRFAFSQNDIFRLALHPSAEQILGPKNIAFMHGPSHKALRATFLSLFTRKALSNYLETQYGLIKEHVSDWVGVCAKSSDGFVEMWSHCRLLNTLTSQTVFLGKHLDDPKLFTDLFMVLTQGFLAIPIYFPGTGLWNAVRAREKIVEMLDGAAAKSKRSMTAGNEPACLLDFWSQHMLTLVKKAQMEGINEPPEHSTDHEMAEVLLDFLFAAQDASTSSLDWTLALMAEYPEIFERVRQEQLQVRPNGEPITFENVENMIFTRAVVMEILRFRPPAPMMPFIAQQDVQLTDDYTLPKGAMLIADIWKPTIEGFPNGTSFDPERMMPERKEDSKYRESFLTFGHGQHLCVGQNYAVNHLVCFLAHLARTCELQRKRTEKSDGIQYLPTVCPADCLMNIKLRQ